MKGKYLVLSFLLILFALFYNSVLASDIVITPESETDIQYFTDIFYQDNINNRSQTFTITYNGEWLAANYSVDRGAVFPYQIYFSSLTPFSDVLNSQLNEYSAILYIENSLRSSINMSTADNKLLSVTRTYTINWGETAEQTGYVEEYASTIVAQVCNNISNDYDKVKLLHDFVVNNFSFVQNSQNGYPFKMITGDKSGNSKAIAALMRQLLNKAGIESRIISQNSYVVFDVNQESQRHFWNLVKLGDKWYHLDAAFDKYYDNYHCFLKSDSSVRVTHSWFVENYPESNSDYFKAPVITINNYNKNLTNQNITVTASTDVGTLNASSHRFTENGSFNFIATNGFISTTYTVTIANIDKTPPVITIGEYNTAPTNKSITITASTNEGTLNIASQTAEANGNYRFIATDFAGNVTIKTISITNIDKTPPVVSGVVNNNYYNKNVIITFNEGTARLNGVTFYNGSAATTERSHNLVVTDLAGNQTIITFVIDKTAPKVTGVTDKGCYNTNVVISFDEGTAKLDGVTFLSGSIVSAEGTYNLVITDLAGNVKDMTFTLDKTPPKISGITNLAYYKSNVTISYNEGTAKLNGITFNSGTTVSNERNHNLIVTDLAGNKTTVTFTIDKTSPKVTGVVDKEYYSSSVVITFNEGAAKLNGNAFSSGSKVTAEGNYTLIVTDMAGNTATIAFSIGNSKIESDTYLIDLSNGYISNIGTGINISVFKSNLENSTSQIKVFRDDGGENISGVMGTGMKVNLVIDGQVKQTLTVKISGDIDGNGKITITDMLKIKAVLLHKNELTGVYPAAGDINGDGNITITDLLKVKADILNKEKINSINSMSISLIYIVLMSFLIIQFKYLTKGKMEL